MKIKTVEKEVYIVNGKEYTDLTLAKKEEQKLDMLENPLNYVTGDVINVVQYVLLHLVARGLQYNSSVKNYQISPIIHFNNKEKERTLNYYKELFKVFGIDFDYDTDLDYIKYVYYISFDRVLTLNDLNKIIKNLENNLKKNFKGEN